MQNTEKSVLYTWDNMGRLITHTYPESIYFCSQDKYRCLELVDIALLNSLTV